ncbi:MAG: hypothetical protein ACR2KL_03925, partial [Nocardioidaceae bacterium]
MQALVQVSTLAERYPHPSTARLTLPGVRMFNTINGLPVHALAVHAVVVLVPLSALLGVLFVVPRLRSWSRLPLPLVALAAVVATFVARQSGQALRNVG